MWSSSLEFGVVGQGDLFGMSVLRTLHLAEKKRQNHAFISSSSSWRLYCFLVGCEQ